MSIYDANKSTTGLRSMADASQRSHLMESKRCNPLCRGALFGGVADQSKRGRHIRSMTLSTGMETMETYVGMHPQDTIQCEVLKARGQGLSIYRIHMPKP